MAIGPDLTNRAHITLTDQTSLRDLKDFTDKLGDQSLRAFKTKDGDTILYAKSGDSSFLSKLFGIASRRQNLAKTEIQTVLQRYQTKLESDGQLKPGTYTNDVFATTTKNYSLVHADRTADDPLRARDVRTLVDTAFGIYHNLTGNAEKTSIPDKLAGQLGDRAKTIVHEFASELKAGKSVDELGEKLGAALDLAIKEHLEGSEQSPESFILNDLPQLRRDLLVAIKTELRSIGSAGSPNFLKTEEAIHKGVLALASTLLDPPKMESATTITLGDRSYKLDTVLSEGSFGTAAKYVDVETGDPIAVKLPKGGMPGDKPLPDSSYVAKGNFSGTNMVEEFLRHKDIQGDKPHDNILQVKGVFQVETGEVGIAMELAPHGTLFDLGQKLNDGVKSQGFPTEKRNQFALTAFKDIVTGLKDIQDRGFVHGDLKTPNVFVGEGGVMKIADFGTAQGGGGFKLVSGEQVENPIYLAPEVVRGKNSIDKIDKFVDLAKDNFKTNFMEVYSVNLEEDVGDHLNAVVDEVVDFYREDLRSDLQSHKDEQVVSPKSDTWAAGVCLYELMTGRQFTGNLKFNFLHEKALGNFTSGFAIGEGGHFGFPSTGSIEVDALINRMLDPVAEKRPTMEEVLNDPLLKDLAIGSPGVRKEMVEMVTDPGAYFKTQLEGEIRDNLQEASDIAGEFLKTVDDLN